jgi:hypothetical protein
LAERRQQTSQAVRLRGIGGYVDRYHHRPHSRLGYKTPYEAKETWEDLQNIAA